MNNKTIGERIKAARKAKGLSQEQLGEKLDISFQAVSSWETGKFIPDSEHLPALAKALDISLDSLLGCWTCCGRPTGARNAGAGTDLEPPIWSIP